MQQVAASNNDIAAQKLFPGDIDAEASGAGNEFAKFMIKSDGSADSSGAEQNYRGHGDVKAVTKEPEKSSEQSADQTQDAEFNLKSPADKQPSQQNTATQEDELHEEWISIIQKLNGGAEGSGKEIKQKAPSDSDSLKLADSDSLKLAESELLKLADGQSMQTSTGQIDTVKAEQETDEPIVEESGAGQVLLELEAAIESGLVKPDVSETSGNTGQDASDVANAEDWKQQLKDKLLNSGQSLNVHQIKSVDKTVNSMSDEEIQQLLNDDQALKQMMANILKVDEPDPQDVALLMALAEQNNDTGRQNTISLEELINGQGASSETTSENTEDEQSETNELFNQTLVEDIEAQTRTDIESDPVPIPPPQPAPESSALGDGVTENSTVSGSETVKAEQLQLAQLLSELDNATTSNESKLAAVENLSRRIESSEIGQTPAGKKFLESLKNVTAEFKDQLKVGHEPGLNITKMVSDAMLSEAAAVEKLALEQQVRGALQQMVNVTQASSGLDLSAREGLLTSFNNSMAARVSNVAQVEAQKTQQQTLQTQAFDKAVNIQKPEAAQELANKVQVMMNQKNMVADIRLDPPELGQMQIKISMQGESASVSMVVQSQAAREVLEQNQPRLKELLEQQGIELGQSSVREEQQGQKGEGDGQNFASGKGQEAMDDVEAEMTENQRYVEVDEPEGIDYFA